MSIEFISSSDHARLHDWDEFMMGSARGHFCTLSSWLRSFSIYGFDFGILATSSAGQIVGGIALLEYRAAGMCILSSPIGPNVREGSEACAGPLVNAALAHARSRSAIFLQLQLPITRATPAPPVALDPVPLPSGPRLQVGQVFRTGNAPGEMLWLEFPPGTGTDEITESLLAGFPSRMRRDIRAAERAGVTVSAAGSPDELHEAYALIEATASAKGYAVRPWSDFGPAAAEQVRSGHAAMLVARFEGEVVAVNYAILAGRRMTYMMGGSVRLGRNIPVGAALHWRSIVFAVERGLLGYDFGARGPEGVRGFKEGFGPRLVEFETPRYYVLAPMRFRIFSHLYPWLRRRKSAIAHLLAAARRRSA